MSSSIPIESAPVRPTADAFRRACGRFATGVAIATTMDAEGTPHGLTINSFSSVSLDPPLVLFCLDRASQALTAFEQSTGFIINLLHKEQQDLSQRFASHRGDRFAGLEWRRGLTGAPVIPHSLAVIECKRHSMLDGGDHIIFLGEVVAVAARDGDPLLYFAGRYRHLGE